MKISPRVYKILEKENDVEISRVSDLREPFSAHVLAANLTSTHPQGAENLSLDCCDRTASCKQHLTLERLRIKSSSLYLWKWLDSLWRVNPQPSLSPRAWSRQLKGAHSIGLSNSGVSEFSELSSMESERKEDISEILKHFCGTDLLRTPGHCCYYNYMLLM